MRRKIHFVILIVVSTFYFTNCGSTKKNHNIELQKLVVADQKDRMSGSDEPWEPKDELRRKRIFVLLANNKILTAKDKLNAALILQHTGMVFCNKKLKSKSMENHYLAYQLSKAAYRQGSEKARRYIALTYDRYSWMAFGYQKYGTQSTFIDDQEVWVKIDTKTSDEERVKYNIAPLAELLKQKSMQ